MNSRRFARGVHEGTTSTSKMINLLGCAHREKRTNEAAAAAAVSVTKLDARATRVEKGEVKLMTHPARTWDSL